MHGGGDEFIIVAAQKSSPTRSARSHADKESAAGSRPAKARDSVDRGACAFSSGAVVTNPC